MLRGLVILGFLLSLAAGCGAQEKLVIRIEGRQEQPADAEKIYMSACLAVEREFRITRPIRPSLTLVVGADENGAYWGPEKSGLQSGTPTFLRKEL
jgi:hypothetical protein